ncbi:hypothetical protein HID58_090415 [Brassica napus]|uniref:Uncharacterized protein n=1 Tax=Brassica napus TaxID=3708 RepID=A0ABQ7WZI3_BRANA|nr:hypothetical protein HID58_090415 [Brassica napus]
MNICSTRDGMSPVTEHSTCSAARTGMKPPTIPQPSREPSILCCRARNGILNITCGHWDIMGKLTNLDVNVNYTKIADVSVFMSADGIGINPQQAQLILSSLIVNLLSGKLMIRIPEAWI